MSSTFNNALKRIVSAAILLPVYVYFFFTNDFMSIPVLILSIVISVFCLIEFYQISSAKETGKPFFLPGIITAVLINILMYMYAYGNINGYNRYFSSYDLRPVLGVLALFIIVIAIIQVWRRPLDGTIFSLSSSIFGLIYIVIGYSHIILMKALPNGSVYILLLHVMIMLNDSFAYFGGVLFGKHKVGFAVSPNKSWEGYFSGILFGIISMMVANEVLITFYDLHLFSKFEAAFLGLLLSLSGNTGDLIESAIKRDAGIKDSGTIIPGHGGMWDVFDALIFAFPVFYYYLKIRGI
ncbi:MAG: phosphatidate cytidylyltransferase [Spirochaetes bacterium]|nr:phosphatidate cytidylyltransferase [Spirochaetota bacterium]